MSTPRTGRRRSTLVALALATTAAGTGVLSLAAAPAAGSPLPAVAQVQPAITDEDAREGAVSAILIDATGRPTFVEVVAPTVGQAVQRAAAFPGSDGVAIDTPMTALAVDDPYRSQQWSLDRLGVDRLPVATDRAQQLVAVVDTGVRASHEDFARGQVRCDLGADFTGEALGACSDPKGHGTHVAGIVGALADNGTGVASVAPGTAILPVRVLDSTGSGGSTAVARGIVHAADRGAKVINLSLGGPGRSSALDAAVQYATDRGALVVASAGNNRATGNEVNYPAASPGALAVASTERNDVSSPFSYSGPAVDIAAPGGGILSTWGNGGYATVSGTSMAAPAVSAVASLYRAAHPAATPAEVQAALVSTAVDLETPGRDDHTGAGLVDPYALLVGGPTSPPTTSPAPVVAEPPVVAPAPKVRVVTPRTRPGQAVPILLSDFRPASTVTVVESWTATEQVQVRRAVTEGGRTFYRTSWETRRTTKSAVLATVPIAADGTARAQVLPVQGVRAGMLVLRGVDRAGKVVQSVRAIRVA